MGGAACLGRGDDEGLLVRGTWCSVLDGVRLTWDGCAWVGRKDSEEGHSLDGRPHSGERVCSAWPQGSQDRWRRLRSRCTPRNRTVIRAELTFVEQVRGARHWAKYMQRESVLGTPSEADVAEAAGTGAQKASATHLSPLKWGVLNPNTAWFVQCMSLTTAAGLCPLRNVEGITRWGRAGEVLDPAPQGAWV